MAAALAPDWRSLLYVPANVPRFVDKAHERGADAIILDLEDSVPDAAKQAARDALPAAIPAVSRGGADVLVRINAAESMEVADLDAAVRTGVSGLLISKSESAARLQRLDKAVTALEAARGLAQGGVRFVVVIESPAAFLAMPEIFRASRRNVAAILGSEDFSLACDMQPDDDALLYPKQQLVIAARACGLAPYGFISTVADFSDPERFRGVVQRSRRFGFAGATCIHPMQVAIVNEAYTPSADEIAQARAVVAAADAAAAAGRGSVQLDSKMVDAPVLERAKRLLARAELRAGSYRR